MGNLSTMITSLVNVNPKIADTTYKYWDQLDKSLKPMGDATKELVTLCKSWWWIPLVICGIVIAVLIGFGGVQGRTKARTMVGILLLATAIISALMSLAAMFLGFFNMDASQLTV